MSVGMVLLTAAAILVFFGVAQRVLDKMYLSDRAALLLIALLTIATITSANSTPSTPQMNALRRERPST